MLVDALVLTAGFALGFSLVSYRSMAERNGWIIGTWLQKEASVPAMLGFVLCVLTLGRGLFDVQPWWIALAALGVGYLLGMVLTTFLKNWAPVIFTPLAVLVMIGQIWLIAA